MVIRSHRIRLLWRMTCDDINTTLRHVCTKILTDNSVSIQTRNRRARILQLIGEQYCKNKVSPSEALDEFLTRLGRQTGLFGAEESTEFNPFAEQQAEDGDEAVDGVAVAEEEKEGEDYSKIREATKAKLLVLLSQVDTISIKQLKDEIVALQGHHTDCLEKKDLVLRLNTLIAEHLNVYEDSSLD